MLLLEVGEIAKALEKRLNYRLNWLDAGPFAKGICLIKYNEFSKIET